MLTDPLAITYDGNAKSLTRIRVSGNRTIYRTADGELEIRISSNPVPGVSAYDVAITMARRLPDPTPANVFDDYREIRNEFTLAYRFDTTRAEASDNIPKLRTALLAFVDSALQSRLLAGEK